MKQQRSKPSSPDYLARIFALDLRSLALFRIAIASFVIYDLISRAFDLTAHYTDAGLLPRNWASQYFSTPLYHSWNPTSLSIHFLSGSTFVIALLFLLHVVAAAALLVGYRTRLMTVIVWFLVISLQARNPLVLSVGDDVLRVMLFFSMFLPLGERFSIDKKKTLQADCYLSAGTAVFYLQFIAIYFFSALLKSGREWRSEGTALYYAFNIDQFALPLAKSLLQHPILLKTLTFISWWVELLSGFLLLVPMAVVKLCGIFLIVALQAGIGVTLSLGHNPWVNTIVLLPFIPTSVWNRRWSAQVQARRPRWQKFWWREGLAVFFFACVVVYNTAWLVPLPGLSDLLNFPTVAVRLEQYWGMFAPAPNRDDGWYVVEGRLKNGANVDAFHESAKLTYEKPASAGDFYPNERWRRYMMNIGTRDFKDLRLPFLQYMCTRWNDGKSGAEHMDHVSLFFMREVTPPPGQVGSVQKLLFFDLACRP